MKIIVKLSICFMILVYFNMMCGCGKKDDTFQVTAKSILSEYDVETKTEGKKKEDTIIKCGERYKLSFDFDFSNIKEVIGNRTIEVTMKVKLGAFENEDNIALLTSSYVQKGVTFEHKSNGIWEAVFELSKKDIPDFSKAYFIIGVDSVKDIDSHKQGQTIAVTFSTKDKKFDINGFTEYQMSFDFEKGTFEFTEEENISLGDINIKVPENCEKITLMIYDSTKTTLYGTENFSNKSFYSNGILSIRLSDYIKEYLGAEEYEKMIALEGNSLYLVIIAEGEDSYQDAFIEMEYFFD